MEIKQSYCYRCGNTFSFEDRFCRTCGAHSVQELLRGNLPPEPESPIKPLLPLVIVVFGSILLTASADAVLGERFAVR
jgi:hypothetical protein